MNKNHTTFFVNGEIEKNNYTQVNTIILNYNQNRAVYFLF